MDLEYNLKVMLIGIKNKFDIGDKKITHQS